jgi:hypothetical protein
MNPLAYKSAATRHLGARVLAVGLLVCAAVVGPGCFISPFLRASELKGDHEVKAKYTGFGGKSFAVVVAADRMIQADFPQLVGQLTTTVANRIQEKVGEDDPALAPTGWVPPESILNFQYRNPRWIAMSARDLAKELGVDRLVYVDVSEFRLSEPGNAYLWAGVAAGTVSVYEVSDLDSEGYAFHEAIRVTFPTKEKALGPAQLSGDVVQIELAKRFVDRASWLFYDHREKNIIDY